MKDPDTGAESRNVYLWEMPPEFKQDDMEEKKEWNLKRTKSMATRKRGEWEEMKDPDTGALFYYSESRNVYLWEMPPEFKQDDMEEKKEWNLKRTKSMATKTKGDWEEMKDPDTGALFYYNHKTGANQWEKPPEFKQEETEEKKEWGLKRTKSMSARKVGEWEEMKDPDSGAFFYYNHKTGANQREMPSEFTAQVQVEVDAPSDSAQLGMKRTKSMRLRKFGDWEELKEEESG